MDCIHIRDLEIWAKHGVYPEENTLGQKFVVSADLYLDVRRAGMEDELELSVDYGAVCHRIKRFMEEHTCKLLEAVAERLAACLLRELPIEKVRKALGPGGAAFGYCVGGGGTGLAQGLHCPWL